MDGGLVTREAFRQWLEADRKIGSLDQFVSPVIEAAAGPHVPSAQVLAEAVLDACYGCLVFDRVDWRRRYRDLDRIRRPNLQRFRATLEELITDLLEPGDCYSLSPMTASIEARLRKMYQAPTFSFPEPIEFFLLDVLHLIADELDPDAAKTSLVRRPHVSCHGCLDYGSAIKSGRNRDRRQMLAFNLVFLFRAASSGQWATEGSMPTKGRPHSPLAARLVDKLFPEQAHGAGAGSAWVDSTVKGIKRDIPDAKVIRWPTGTYDMTFQPIDAPGA